MHSSDLLVSTFRPRPSSEFCIGRHLLAFVDQHQGHLPLWNLVFRVSPVPSQDFPASLALVLILAFLHRHLGERADLHGDGDSLLDRSESNEILYLLCKRASLTNKRPPICIGHLLSVFLALIYCICLALPRLISAAPVSA